MEKTDLVKDFTERGLHWGGRRTFVHPKMKKFIFTYKGDLAVINLQKSVELWEKMMEALKEMLSQGKTVLFVGTQPSVQGLLRQFGEEMNVPFMTSRWLGGTITNFETFKNRLEHLKELEAKIISPDFEKYTKKERGLIQMEAEDIRKKFDGLVKMQGFPDAIFVFCGKKHRTAVSEALRKKIKVFGIFGLEDNPEVADYFVPLNDNVKIGADYIISQIKDIYQKHLVKPEKPVKKEKE